MRTIIYLLLFLSFIGCKKDNSSESEITGVWLFKEGRYGTGGGVKVIKADPLYPIQLLLKKDGRFSITKLPYTTSFQVRLLEFDRYQALPNNEVRFYNTTNGEEITFYFELNKELKISQPGCREGCSDYFVRGY